MATYRDIDSNTRINGELLVSSAVSLQNNLTVSGILATGAIANVETAINSKFASAGGTVSGNVTITGNLTVNGTITGVDLTQYYTKANLQTSGQSSVHWDNLTNKPTYDNYVGWKFAVGVTTYDTITTNGILTFKGTNAVTITRSALNELTFSAPVHPATHALDMITETTGLKVMTAAERTKLAGIADNANLYVHPANHAATVITEDTTHRFVTDVQITDWADAVSKEHTHANKAILDATDQSFTSALKTKLDGISTGANKTASSLTNGNIKIDNVETTVYTHSANHPASMITQATDLRFMTDAERTKLSGIATNANLYVHPTTHSIDIIDDSATYIRMTPAERTKLSGIATSANLYVHPANHPPSIISQDTTNRFVTDAQITLFHTHANKAVLDGTQESFTTTLKSKLDGISTNAKKVESSATNGNIKIDGVETTVYTHSATHSIDMINDSATYVRMTPAERTKLTNLETNFYSKTELQTSGSSSVHWNNITNKPTYDNYQGWKFAIGVTTYETIGSNGTLTFKNGGATTVTRTAANEITISSVDTTYTAGNGLLLTGTVFSTKLGATPGLTVDANGLVNADKGSSQYIFKNMTVDGTTTSATTNNDTFTFASSGVISASISGKTITYGHTDANHTTFPTLSGTNSLTGINTFTSQLVLQPANPPANVTVRTSKTFVANVIELGNPIDALTEVLYKASTGADVWVKDVDYTINYKTGTLTRLVTGGIALNGTVYVTYTPTQFVLKVKGSASDNTDYFQIDNRGNMYGKSMTVTLTSSQSSTSNDVQGDFVIQGNLAVNGQTTLGDANTDLTKINGSFSIYNGATPTFTITNAGDMTAGAVPWARLTGKPTTISGYGITDALNLGETSTTAYRGDRGKAAYDHISNNGSNHSYINQSVTTTSTPTFSGIILNNNNINVGAMDGLGLQFWGSDAYKIYMSATGVALLGGRLDSTSDYNMYFKMTGATNRGFVFKRDNTPVAQIDASGNLYLTGSLLQGTVPWARVTSPTTISGYGISDALNLGETSTTAYRGDRGKSAYDHISNNGSAHSFINQDLKTTATPTFAGLTVNDVSKIVNLVDMKRDYVLELNQAYGTAAYPISLRFHQTSRWYTRIEATGSGFYFKTGDPASQTLLPIIAADVYGSAFHTGDGTTWTRKDINWDTAYTHSQTAHYTHPNHSGDVTSTGDGATVIGADKVTYAKMQNMTTARILGRVTASTGDIEELTATQARTLLNVADGANAYTHPANHPPSTISQDASNRFVTDAEKTTWNGKQDALGYTPVNKAGDNITGALTFGNRFSISYNATQDSLEIKVI